MDDDATDAKPLSAGKEAARDMIDAYKSFLQEKRRVDREMGTEGVEGESKDEGEEDTTDRKCRDVVRQ